MESTSEPLAPKRKRRIKVIHIVLLAPVVILLLAALFVMWHQMTLESQIAAELEKIRARGEPYTAAELQASYAVPKGAVDQTDRWMAVIAQVDAVSKKPAYTNLPFIGLGDESTIPAAGQPWADEPTIALYLSELEPALAELKELSENPGEVRIPHEFSQGFNMLLPNIQNLRQVARMLALRAHWQVYHGDPQGAVESLIAMRRTADVAKHDPIMVSQLVRIAINGIMSSYTLELLPQANWSDAQLEQLQRELLDAPASDDIMYRSLVGERVLGSMVFEEGNAEGLMEQPYHMPLTRRSDQLFHLQILGRMVAASEQPFPEAQAEFQAIDREVAGQSKWELLTHPLSSLITPPVAAMHSATGRTMAADRATATLLACERYRLANGKWPVQLADLTPEFLKSVPLDPYDGQPLRYKVTPTAVIVYSVGENLVDDGGIAPPTAVGDWREDHAYSIELPSPAAAP